MNESTEVRWDGFSSVGVPAPGTNVYRAFLFTCSICHASVVDGSDWTNRRGHEEWHRSLAADRSE